jgi:hypothetical protein
VGLSSSMAPWCVRLCCMFSDRLGMLSQLHSKHTCWERSASAQLQASAQQIVTTGAASKCMCSTTAAAAVLFSSWPM